MKLLTLLFIGIANLTFGQIYFSNQEYYLNRIKNKVDDPFIYEKPLLDQAKKYDFAQVTKTNSFNKGKKNYSVSYLFNDNQKLTEVKYSTATLHIEYLEDTLISSIVRTGTRARTTKIEYQGANKVLEESFSPKKLISRTVIQYNNDNNIIFSSVSGKKTYSMYYDYSDSKLTHQRFMKNRKILKEWDYSCKPEGETVEEKNLSTVCNYVEESNDGSYINYSRREQKGKIILSKTYFTKDSVCYLSESFENEDQLINTSEYKDNSYTYTQFNSKGKVDYQYITEYNDQKQVVVKRFVHKGKFEKARVIHSTYNDKGLLVNETTTQGKKQIQQQNFEYIY